MSIYKTFRNYSVKQADPNSLSSRFDQPTYLSFKLIFANNLKDIWYNGAGTNYFGGLNYDRMPHPLFMSLGTYGINDRQSYSAVDYLLDANEYTRAQMLEEFKIKWLKLQNDFQWYFQKIEGVEELLKIDPKKGIRVSNDARLTITALEGVDLRMSHLLNLYRKIAWDDTYQRWVLPDMMRYFTLKIYISEFRQFHSPNQYNGLGIADYRYDEYKTEGELQLKLLDDILPTWVINCEMCEFDLESYDFNYLQNLSISEDPAQAEIKFKIKVGKIFEEQTYPVFQNAYLYDKILNGFNRSKTTDNNNGSEIPYDSTLLTSGTELNKHSTILGIAQGHQMQVDQKSVHTSGRPFNQMENDETMFGEKNNSNGIQGNTSLYSHKRKWKEESAEATKPETWWNNAVDFGSAFGKNLGNKFIDKAKLTEIPGLGFSFNEAEAALQSKDIVTAFGLIRKAITTVTNDYVEPSERLEGKIVDELFKSYLNDIVRYQSGHVTKLQEAANFVLGDNGTWQKIKDFSLATDLVSQGEINTKNVIKEGNLYANMVNESTKGDLSLATNLISEGETNVEKKITNNIIYEGVPSSQATNGIIIKG